MPPWPSAITRPGCFAKPVRSCGGSCRFPTALRSSNSPHPCRGRQISPPPSAPNPTCSSWAGSIRGKGSTCCWRRWSCCGANAIATSSWRDADRKGRHCRPWPQRLGLARQVHFVGQTAGQQKLWLLQNGLCTVVPSRIWEAFGVVAVESLAAGRPVIASQLPGLADLIQHGRTGLLVPPESPQRLAEAIRQIVLDPQLADELGNAARRFVRAFDWRNIAQRHLDLFEELIASKRRLALHDGTLQSPAENRQWPTAAHARPPIALARPTISVDREGLGQK